MSASRHADANLNTIRVARIEARTLARKISDTVTTARNNGATWEEIGDALAMTKQAAQQRFGRANR